MQRTEERRPNLEPTTAISTRNNAALCTPTSLRFPLGHKCVTRSSLFLSPKALIGDCTVEYCILHSSSPLSSYHDCCASQRRHVGVLHWTTSVVPMSSRTWRTKCRTPEKLRCRRGSAETHGISTMEGLGSRTLGPCCYRPHSSTVHRSMLMIQKP